MAEDALRVLGIAYRSADADDRGTRIEQNFIWAGLVGMADPIRKGAPSLIDAFRRAGITSIMLTGDQRATAAAVAAELRLSNGSRAEIVEAAQLEAFEAATADGDLSRVFARVAPGQKLQLVKKLQRSGRVVAMIGDGVNDTPPLRAADIGIALGRSGVEAARGIADVVLLEDDLASLTDAVERGRTVAINIRKAIRYLVATNLSEIIFMLVAAAAGRAHPVGSGLSYKVSRLALLEPLADVPDPFDVGHARDRVVGRRLRYWRSCVRPPWLLCAELLSQLSKRRKANEYGLVSHRGLGHYQYWQY